VSGETGTGKSSVACHVADAACRRGERVLHFLFEESPGQIVRNQRSIGLDLEPWVQRGLLQFQAVRPTFHGLESHLTIMHRNIVAFQPRLVVMDPISAFDVQGNPAAHSLFLRLIDFLKRQNITGLFTSLTQSGTPLEGPTFDISSLMDSWIRLQDQESNGERNRSLTIVKSRGMAHSNQVREFLLTDHGIELRDVYTGPGGVLLGTARFNQEARDESARLTEQQAHERRQRAQARTRHELEARIEVLRAEYAAELELGEIGSAEYELGQTSHRASGLVLARERGADPPRRADGDRVGRS
jgi:circadian clock protein KaiC